MEDQTLKTCIDCANKQKIDGQLDIYFCKYALADLVPRGMVQYDTDATQCIEKGWFIPISSKK